MVEVTDIRKHYKKKEVLTGVSFRASPGACVGIVGGNGCGKTTLLSILAGILKADGGSVRYFGEEVMGRKKAFARYVAYVPQENPLMEELSVRDNLRLWFQGDKKSMEEDLERGTSAMLGLKDTLAVQAGKLSGGMKKRLSIACSLSNHAPVLVMDEPGAALDLVCKEVIRAYLNSYRKSGGTVILTSHEMEELRLCDSMYLLKDGTLKGIPSGLTARELASLL